MLFHLLKFMVWSLMFIVYRLTFVVYRLKFVVYRLKFVVYRLTFVVYRLRFMVLWSSYTFTFPHSHISHISTFPHFPHFSHPTHVSKYTVSLIPPHTMRKGIRTNKKPTAIFFISKVMSEIVIFSI